MESFDLHQFKIVGLITLSVISVALIRSKRIAELFESTTIRWIEALRNIKAAWRNLPIEKPPQRPAKKNRKKRQLKTIKPSKNLNRNSEKCKLGAP